jgi:hypothetical protein
MIFGGCAAILGKVIVILLWSLVLKPLLYATHSTPFEVALQKQSIQRVEEQKHVNGEHVNNDEQTEEAKVT